MNWASAEGCRVVDSEGREYIDLMAGWGVTCIGHCHPALVEAIRDQAGRLMQTTNVFFTPPQTELLERLAAVSPPEITRSFFTNSGAEAVEGAIKLAHRATGRAKFVSIRIASRASQRHFERLRILRRKSTRRAFATTSSLMFSERAAWGPCFVHGMCRSIAS